MNINGFDPRWPPGGSADLARGSKINHLDPLEIPKEQLEIEWMNSKCNTTYAQGYASYIYIYIYIYILCNLVKPLAANQRYAPGYAIYIYIYHTIYFYSSEYLYVMEPK